MNILEKILEFNQIDIHNIKLELMRESPFTFFRGTSHLFFEHLNRIIRKNRLFQNGETLCWIQGDAHINNLGFSNRKSSTVNRVRFDINDFDEAFIGNPLLDVIRFGVSIGLYLDELTGANESLDMVYSDTDFIELFVKEYFHYASIKERVSYPWRTSKIMKSLRKKAKKRADASHEKSRINRFTKDEDGRRVFDLSVDGIEDIEAIFKDELLKKLSNIEVVDIVRRVSAGVGSAHLERYYILVKHQKEYVLLEMKEQLEPAYLNYFPEYRGFWKNGSVSQLHIRAKKRMVEDVDIHLKAINFRGKSFLIKSIFNAKYSASDRIFSKNIDQFKKNLKEYIRFSAISLSNSHKKSALKKGKFHKVMREVNGEKLKEVEILILKSYATNISMFSHYVRDYDKLKNGKLTY